MFSMTLWLLSALVPLQILLGDLHGLNTLEHQPAKLAAIESHWETASRVPLTLFAIPDEISETNRYSVEIPILGSLVLAHDPNAVIKGLKDWPPRDRPPVAIPFFAFRLMVGIGVLMLVLTLAGLWIWHRGALERARGFQRLCVWATPLGFVAVVAGWVVTEVGRQPWVVYGLQRTRDAVTPSLHAGDVTVSLLVYIATYLVIFGTGLYLALRLVRDGFDARKDPEPAGPLPTSARPLSAATRAD